MLKNGISGALYNTYIIAISLELEKHETREDVYLVSLSYYSVQLRLLYLEGYDQFEIKYLFLKI